MHRICFAPVLSATLSRDSCWIIGYLHLLLGRTACPPGDRVHCRAGTAGLSVRTSLGLLEHLHDAPALGGRQRTGLHDEHPVTDAALVLLVVCLELARTPQHLAVQGVLDPVLDGHHDGL